MAMTQEGYKEIRSRMLPGDVIAFSGKGEFSEIIKWATRSNVSHVGVVSQTQVLAGGAAAGDMQNQVIESTTLGGFSGVCANWLSARIEHYDGEVWWLPVRRSLLARVDHAQFLGFLRAQLGKPYDMRQAIGSAADLLDKIPVLGGLTRNHEDFTRFFCSELVAAALEKCDALPALNSAEVTPIDLCMFNIYEPDYVQIKGQTKPIKGYNTLDPTGWGQ